MGQQEDFRTPDDALDAARGTPNAPIFDERSAQKAAPVVPLEQVARRKRFTNLTAGGWREAISSPRFRRSWPLALLLVATLAAAVAATNFYRDEDAAQTVAPATNATTATTGDDTAAKVDARKPAASAARNETDNARGPRRAGEDGGGPDEKSVVNPEAFTASALGGLFGNAGDDQPDAVAERGERDKGKGHKRSKRRHGARRNSGGAILFDVIR